MPPLESQQMDLAVWVLRKRIPYSNHIHRPPQCNNMSHQDLSYEQQTSDNNHIQFIIPLNIPQCTYSVILAAMIHPGSLQPRVVAGVPHRSDALYVLHTACRKLKLTKFKITKQTSRPWICSNIFLTILPT